MIYLDTSVALAHLLAEDRCPPESLWEETLIASRLLEYETWNRVRAYDLGATHAGAVDQLLGRLAFLEMIPEVLGRAREPFPVAVRTLDALHLASLLFLREQGRELPLASYDDRLLSAARALGIGAVDLG